MIALKRFLPSSSAGWTRTTSRPVNSRVLCQLSYNGMERATGFEPVLTAWKAVMLAINIMLAKRESLPFSRGDRI